MRESQPILKFTKIQDGPDTFIEMELSEFHWPEGGVGKCPVCGAKVVGVGKDWVCEGEDCGAKFNGPIF